MNHTKGRRAHSLVGDNAPSRLATPYLGLLEIGDAILEVVLYGGLLPVAAVMKGDLKKNFKNELHQESRAR
jgi:hypothetical protein